MVQWNLTLSDDANAFIQQQLSTGQFATPDEVVSKTLENARLGITQSNLAALVREGLNCTGAEIEFSEEWFDQRLDAIRAESEQGRRA